MPTAVVRALLDEHASRGEAVLLLHLGAETEEVTDEAILAALGPLLDQGTRSKEAAESVAGSLGVSKRRTYQLALQAKGRS